MIRILKFKFAKFITCIFFVLLSQNCFSTCIIVYITKNGIFFGADSKKILNGKTLEVNKIKKAGKFYYALAGLSEYKDSKYYPEKIISKILDTAKVYSPEVANRIKEIIILRLRKTISKINNTQDRQFWSSQTPNLGIFQLAIVGFKDNMPSYSYINITIDDLNNPNFTTSEGINISKLEVIRGFGLCKEVYSFINSPRQSYHPLNEIQIINDLINISIKYHPDFVGKPIHILKAYNNQFNWVQ